MICRRCHRRFANRRDGVCPHCGESNSAPSSGIVKTSTILISAEGTDAVYRSVADVPDPLRAKLLKSTNGLNSATVLIADRRGKEELAKAIRRLPNNVQPKLLQALFGTSPEGTIAKFLQEHRRGVLGTLLAALTLLNLWWVVTRKW
jgi:hypothetical protein